MKVHYDHFIDPEEEPRPSCGVNYFDDTEVSNNWDDVTCKRCLNRKKKTIELVTSIENHILDDMAGFVEFMKTYKTE